MKVDPFHIWIGKAFATTLVAVLVAVLVFGLWTYVGIVDDGPDGYYTYHQGSGYIIGKNVSRMVFYVETETTLKIVPVDVDTLYRYDIGDYYEWEVAVFHRYSGFTNVTMENGWR